jgi:hypothetical protein
MIGIVTEDSDVFLFGGECVYKNMFDEKKYVEVYLAEDAKRELGVSRSEFVCLSYLLGSDYAEGVRGVGIVNAMEILDTFGQQQQHQEEEDSVRMEGHSRSEENTSLSGREGGGGGFMVSDTFTAASPSVDRSENTSLSDGCVRDVTSEETRDTRQKKNIITMSKVLGEVSDTMEQFKDWLFKGHDFVSAIEQLQGCRSAKSSGQEVEPVSERLMKLVRSETQANSIYHNIMMSCIEYDHTYFIVINKHTFALDLYTHGIN